MRPYYFDFDPQRTRRAAAVVAFERAMRNGGLWPAPRPRRLGDMMHAAVALLRLWRRRIHERQQLARLDVRMLRDIGVTPVEVEGEINKPFWRS